MAIRRRPTRTRSASTRRTTLARTPATPPHNLPRPLTSFVGRAAEMEEVSRLVRERPLVTITGPGGSGKTRLAVEAAAALSPIFPHGVWWVDFAPITDPALVPRTVATALGVREQPGKPIATSLAAHLLPRRALLVVDNCEHLVSAVAGLVENLLRTCQELRILATSREAIAAGGEAVFPLSPMSIPTHDLRVSPEELKAFDAAALFVDRALDANPALSLTTENAPTIAALVRRLDGLPLAIELAAARVRALPVDEIAKRMDRRLQLLAGGIRTSLPRHQTLRAAIDWSHDLLPDPERVLFRRLSVFAGGCSLDAIETVCAEDASSTVDLLTRLIDKSLINADADRSRYRMLETVREYARERLIAAGEPEQIRNRHRDFYLNLAGRAEPELRGVDQQRWLRLLQTEHDNLRAALEWSQTMGDAPVLLRLAGALWRFWNVRGFWNEGQTWLERAVAMDRTGTATPERAKAAFGAGVLAWWRDDYHTARFFSEETRRLAEQIGDRRLAADAIRQLAVVASSRGEHAEARRLAELSLHMFEALGDRWGIAAVCRLLGYRAGGNSVRHRAASDHIDLESGARLLNRSLELARELDDRRGIAWSLIGLADVQWGRGDLSAAMTTSKEALTLFNEVGDRSGNAEAYVTLARLNVVGGQAARAQTLAAEGVAAAEDIGSPTLLGNALIGRAEVELAEGAVAAAEGSLRQALQLMHQAGDHGGVADCLDGLAQAAAGRRKWKRAATLLGAAAAARKAVNVAIPTVTRANVERLTGTVRAALGESVFGRTYEAAGKMQEHEMVSYALAESAQAQAPTAAREDTEDLLTDRERQVAVLVARGSSNRDIAATLFISERTVESHIQHILNKLSFRSRVQIAAWAVANRLQ